MSPEEGRLDKIAAQERAAKANPKKSKKKKGEDEE